MSGQIQIDRERCKGCALCIDFCTKDCISLSDELNLKGYFVATFDASKGCTGCRNCALMCPEVAIEVWAAKEARAAIKAGTAGKAGVTADVTDAGKEAAAAVGANAAEAAYS